jgi:hypothetical protein
MAAENFCKYTTAVGGYFCKFLDMLFIFKKNIKTNIKYKNRCALSRRDKRRPKVPGPANYHIEGRFMWATEAGSARSRKKFVCINKLCRHICKQ